MARIRALVVGVDAASNSYDDGLGYDRDARRFANLLTDWLGFDPTELRVLVNRQADRSNVVAGLHWLLGDVQDGDIRVFYFSGLGFRTPSEGLLREVLVLHDGSYLFDNEIGFLTQQAPEQSVTMVLDTCFDGGLEQRLGGPELGVVKAWQPDFTKMDLVDYRERIANIASYKPFGCQTVPLDRAGLLELQFGVSQRKEPTHSTMNAVLVKACQDHEVAVTGRECSGAYSAFTFSLCAFLESRGGFIDGDEAVAGAATELAAMGIGQSPQHVYPEEWGPHEHLSFIAQSPIEQDEDAAMSGGAPADIADDAMRGGDPNRLDVFLRMLPATFEGVRSGHRRVRRAPPKRKVSDGSE